MELEQKWFSLVFSTCKSIEEKANRLEELEQKCIINTRSYRPWIQDHPDNKEEHTYISWRPLVGFVKKSDHQRGSTEGKVLGFNPENFPKTNTESYRPWTTDHRENKEEVQHISWGGFGTDGQSINDQNENTVTENRLWDQIINELLGTTDTSDKYYNEIEKLFDVFQENEWDNELQLSKEWNCSYRFEELPISNILGTGPILIITNNAKEYALEGNTKGQHMQEDDKQIEDQKLKLLMVKQIKEKYNGDKQKQTLLCGMCIQHHEALYFCTTCELNICCRCHRFHKEVWIMMNHVIHLLSENTAA